MLSMIGRIIATIFLIFVPSKVKKTYFICVIGQIISYAIICLSYPIPSAAHALFIGGLTLFGLSRGIFSFPYLLLSQTFESPEDVTAVNIWLALMNLGDAFGLIFGALAVYTF